MTITEEELKRLEGLCEKATPGPWHDFHRDMIGAYDSKRELTVMQFWTPPKPEDRAFVNASRTALPSLLSTIRELREENERLRVGLEWVKNNSGAHYSNINAAACTALGERHD